MFPVVLDWKERSILQSAPASTACEPGNAARDFPDPARVSTGQCGRTSASQASSENVANASTVDSTTARVMRLLSAP